MFLINEIQNEMIMKMIVDQEKLYEQYANYKIVEWSYKFTNIYHLILFRIYEYVYWID